MTNLRPTSIILELANRSKVKLSRALEDVMVSLDSWEYPMEFLVVQPKYSSWGHPMILGRLWMDTIDALNSCV